MQFRVLPFRETVCPVWVGHDLKDLAEPNKAVHQHLGVLIVYVIIRGAVDDQKVPSESLRAAERGRLEIFGLVVASKATVSLLIHVVV
jgi:hypothetical protein